jgi:hypothetical protein
MSTQNPISSPTDWTLSLNGDRIEHDWEGEILKRFSNYERVWSRHVVPLTYRVVKENCIYVRSNLQGRLENLATAHYGVFVHLVGCHQQLRSSRKGDSYTQEERHLFATEGAYNFYSRLYSVSELVAGSFLPAVGKLVKQYKGPFVEEDHAAKGERLARYTQHKSRLDTNGYPGMYNKFFDVCVTRIGPYRHGRVHNWGLLARGPNIPSRELIAEWGSLERPRSIGAHPQTARR